MDSITIDGMEEMEFRRSIEAMLRQGRADDAAEKLKSLLEDYAGGEGLLPERFLQVTSHDVRLEGWERLGERLGEYDRPEMAMSAISIDILDPQGVGARPDEDGRLKPVIETSYFSDSAYPFSEADREDLLDGYSSFGCEWQGNFETIDTTISVEGIDDLYGATVMLENKVANGSGSGIEDIRAGSVGSCYLAVLIHQAIRDAAREKGLPRPICVLAGSNDAYPFFDAPAMTIDEYRGENDEPVREDASVAAFGEEPDDYAAGAEQAAGMASLESLVGLGGKKKEKKPVLTIDPDEADTSESLEMPVPDEDVGAEREHIMPSLDLGAVPTDQWADGPGADAPTDQREEQPREWDDREPAVPSDFTGWQEATPIDFSAYGAPVPGEEPAPDAPATPIDFPADVPPLPDGNMEPAQPAPLDLGDYPPLPSQDMEEEPPAPLERLHSDKPTAPDDIPPDGDSFETAADGPAEPVNEADDSEWLADPAMQDFADGPGADSHAPTGPIDPPDIGLEIEAPHPLDVTGPDHNGGEDSFGIDSLADFEEAAPDDWGSDHDLPAADETGDNLLWPEGDSDWSEAPRTRIEEPKPARHAIRVIAASVSNEGKSGSPTKPESRHSILPAWIAWIVPLFEWVRNRLARR